MPSRSDPDAAARATDGQAEAEVDGETVGEVLDALFDEFADLRDRIAEDGGSAAS